MSDQSSIEVLRALICLYHECETAKAVTGRFQTRQEYTADQRFNAAARAAIPAIEILLGDSA